MSTENSETENSGSFKLGSATKVIIVGSVMLTFISYWRVAAVVLCDLASTAYYIGGIVEQAIGPAAPFFILAVMGFSYAVRALYIESCTLFVRGGVYRVVKTAMGGWLAKLAVSALLFDYILTGPISSVSAGQYLVGWILELLALVGVNVTDEATRQSCKDIGSMVIACIITVYFYRKNIIGIHESSEKALKIIIFTTIIVGLVLIWSFVTLATNGPVNKFQFMPDMSPKVEYATEISKDRVTGDTIEQWQRDEQTGKLIPRLDKNGQPIPKLNRITGHQEDPLGFLPRVFPQLAEKLRTPSGIFSVLGLIGVIVAFGHSILAMSGEETLAQIYREIEAPKLPNFKKAALIIFVYSVLLTGGVSLLAVILIPDEVRIKLYADNLIGGLAMHVIGPHSLRLLLNAGVVVAGFLILSGAVNTSIIGANGVLNRVAEDGVLPEQLQKPHSKYGTTYRIITMIVVLQILTILASRGDMLLLGEAYAFGVVWSFLFNALSMLVLRFKQPGRREFMVPFNIKVGAVDVPIGLSLIFFALALCAVANFFTKEVATTSGLIFTFAFMILFTVSEKLTRKKGSPLKHEHIEQFTEQMSSEVSPNGLGLSKPYRRLVAIRSTQNLSMLKRAMAMTDPDTTDVIVMTAKVSEPGSEAEGTHLDRYDRKLMTAVVELGEKAGVPVHPLIVPTNQAIFAIIQTAKEINAQELIVGASNKFAAQEQLDQLVFYWISLHGGQPAPLTISIISPTWDSQYDVEGGSRIPRMADVRAKTVAELRAAGVGVQRVLVAHMGTRISSDVFEAVLTMLEADIGLIVAHVEAHPGEGLTGADRFAKDQERASKVERQLEVVRLTEEPAIGLTRIAKEHQISVIFVPLPDEATGSDDLHPPVWLEHLVKISPCFVCTACGPGIPQNPEDETFPEA